MDIARNSVDRPATGDGRRLLDHGRSLSNGSRCSLTYRPTSAGETDPRREEPEGRSLLNSGSSLAERCLVRLMPPPASFGCSIPGMCISATRTVFAPRYTIAFIRAPAVRPVLVPVALPGRLFR